MSSTESKIRPISPAPRQSQAAPRSSSSERRPTPLPWPLQLLREGHPAALGILLAALVIGIYYPSLKNGFINLDDPVYVTSNTHVQQGLTWSGFRWAFTAVEASLWHPVTWLSLMLDTQFLGNTAFDYHLTNMLLHTANTVLLFLLLFRLTASAWRSAFVATLFGVHPLHVESVAWISERKDVLSTFFFLLTLLAYTRYVELVSSLKSGAPQPDRKPAEAPQRQPKEALRYYVGALLLFALGLLSKPMLVTTPVILLLMDFWPLKRIRLPQSRQSFSGETTEHGLLGANFSLQPSAFLFLEKLPFFGLALISGIITMFAQRGAGSFMTSTDLAVSHRFDNALLTSIHYLVQMFWPGRYAMYYPYPMGFSTAAVALAVLLLIIISGVSFLNLRSRPYLAFGWAWYLITLLPVIGLIQVGNQAQADRYTYIPLIGVFIMLVWAGSEILKWQIPSLKLPLSGLLGAVSAAACIPFTIQQIGYWKDSETLSRHALEVTRDNPVALNIYGIALSKRGQIDDAIKCWLEAVRIAPHYAHALGNLGTAYFRKGQLDESIKWSSEAIKSKPGLAGAYMNLGAALGVKGRLDEAIAALQQAVRLAPNDPQTHYNLGYALAGKGRYDEAIAEYEKALRLKPDDRGAHLGIQAAAAAKAKRPSEAPKHK